MRIIPTLVEEAEKEVPAVENGTGGDSNPLKQQRPGIDTTIQGGLLLQTPAFFLQTLVRAAASLNKASVIRQLISQRERSSGFD